MLPIRSLLILILTVIPNVLLFAQRIENIDFSYNRTAKTVTINYDLVSGHPKATYTVNIYCINKTDNQELGQIQSITGHNSFGSGVTVGKNKEVIWKLTDDIPQGLSREIQFRIEAIQETASDIASQNNQNYVETVNGVSFTMVYVKGGTFQMGSNDGGFDEKPIHNVTLGDFYMAETEVTQELYEAVMGSNPSCCFIEKQKPVENVSWFDAQAFIIKLNSITGHTYKLPSETQWEYAAGGGSASTDSQSGDSTGYRTKWAGTSNENELGNYAVYNKKLSGLGRSHKDYGTHPVKTKKPNQLGLYDMSGNVLEWCEDGYSHGYSLKRGIMGLMVLRGGSWLDNASNCRVAERHDSLPEEHLLNFGFRILRSVP